MFLSQHRRKIKFSLFAGIMCDKIYKAIPIKEFGKMKKITQESINCFRIYLINQEKSSATVEKYTRDIGAFAAWVDGRTVDKPIVLEHKAFLVQNYRPASVNSVLSSLNSFFEYYERYDCKVKALKIQKQLFASEDKELSKNEYERLLDAARSNQNERLYLLMQAICSTGIRVSEDI